MYTVIVGCGRVGAELAKLLSIEGHDVIIIDQKSSSFDRLGDAFNGITLKGNGITPKLLQEAGIEKASIFCSLTNSDNINIMASLVAKKMFNVPRVIARVYDPRKADIYQKLGLDVLSGTTLFAAMIRDKIVDRRFSSYLIETRELGTIELLVPAKLAGKRIEDLNISGEMMITALHRENEKPCIPRLTDHVAMHDRLVAVVKVGSLNKVKDAFDME